MPGAVDLNENDIKPVSDIARKVGYDSDGKPEWEAGPDAKGYDVGETVPHSYARKARKIRGHVNSVKQVMRNEGISEAEARDRIKVVAQAKKDWRNGDIEKDELDDIRAREVGS